MTSWLEERVSEIRQLEGIRIARWRGTERALTEDRPGGEVWDDSSVPWLQMVNLHFETTDGLIYRISTYQDDSGFGLLSAPVADYVKWLPSGCTIYRWIGLSYMPTGPVSRVEASIQEEIIAEISIVVGGRAVTLKAGEVYEKENDTFHIVWLDEAVMVQLDSVHPRWA